MRRDDKSLTELSAVCEHHFEAHLILRDYVHVIDGVEVRIPRGKPSLAPGAIPTLLPGCPAYLSVKTPKQRTERKRSACQTIPPRSKKPCQDVNSADNEHQEPGELAATESSPFSFQALRGLAPSTSWCRFEDERFGLIFATSSLKMQARLVITHERAVVFKPVGGKVCADIYYQGVMCTEKTVASVGDAAAVLQDAEATCVCKGAMTDDEYRQVLPNLTVKLQAATCSNGLCVFSIKCSGNVPSVGK